VIVAARKVTRSVLGIVLCVLSAHPAEMRADEKSKRFDGDWNTVVSCPNFAGALGYSFEFPSLIREGILHGEKGVKYGYHVQVEFTDSSANGRRVEGRPCTVTFTREL
jgi:hypothetical protein